MDVLIEDYSNAPDVRQPAIQAEIQRLEGQIAAIDRVRGITSAYLQRREVGRIEIQYPHRHDLAFLIPVVCRLGRIRLS